ncbi:MAG: TIGR03862 family flavoprotein [Hyphomicrobiales bacterium]|nr:TIGR03862 family flavoprotein [Hyphomicrobiales bacterium]
MNETKREIVDVAVAGAGPAGLMAAQSAAAAGARVVVFEAMPSAGRKFLMAGRSGLNITHSENFESFAARYGEASRWLRPLLERFSPQDMRAFCADLGVETFVGTSGRVFPKSMKASPLLRAWLRRLVDLGVEFRARRRLASIEPAPHAEFDLTFSHDTIERVRAKAVVLALGGASWPRLGSNAAWTDMLAVRGVGIAPFRASNCGVEIAWSDALRERFEGQAIKTAAFAHGGRSIRGEAVVTRRGLEGGPVYALSAAIGADLRAGRDAVLTIDLKPDMSREAIVRRLEMRRKGDSLSNALRKTLKLSPLAAALLRETGAPPNDPAELAARLKALALPVRAAAGIERAISSAGGVLCEEIDRDLMLSRLPGVFLAGEMLDWDAPTGGYLLQACFATGACAGAAAAAFARNNAAAG